MTPTQLSALLMELLALPQETEWVEWKHNYDHPGDDCSTAVGVGEFGGSARAGHGIHAVGD